VTDFAPADALPFDLETDLFSEDEQETVNRLLTRINQDWVFLRVRELYYDGEQPMRNLGIAVPRELEKLRTAAGWPGVVVDTIDERLEVAGFRVGSAASTDDDLWDIWTANRMEHESGLAHLDALMLGRAFIMVGTRDEDTDDGSGTPLITVESPLNMAATYDAASRQVTAALQRYRYWGDEAAALYLPDVTIQLVRPRDGDWEIRDRDEHGLGRCPVVMLANRSRSNDRYGKSEITPELMSWTDAACRTLLRMEIGAEFFAAPQRYVIGQSESGLGARKLPGARLGIRARRGRQRADGRDIPGHGPDAAHQPAARAYPPGELEDGHPAERARLQRR
jgi:hypothetical protein